MLGIMSMESVELEIKSGAKSDGWYKFTMECLPSKEELATRQEIGLTQPYFNEIMSSGYWDYCLHKTETIYPSASKTGLLGGESATCQLVCK
jgi:hypothetical protein